MSENPPTTAPPSRTVWLDDTEVILLGTAHVSRESAAEVRARLLEGDHDAVAIELCRPRYQRLTGTDDWRELDLLQIVRSGRAGLIAVQLALSAYQQRLADQLGIEPGAEMRAGIEAAEERGLPLWLIDRDVGVTLKRAVRGVPWHQRWTLLTGIVAALLTRSELEESDIEQLKQGDILESTLTEFAKRSPALFNVLIAERDRYMAGRLRERIRDRQPRRVLAVIGAGHVEGIAGQLGSDREPAAERADLETVRPRGRLIRLLPWLVVAAVLAGFAIGFARAPALGWQLVGEWIVINGSLAALGAAIARGHPLTVLVAFLAAPLTSLSPTIGAGMVTGATEAMLRRPRASDFETLREQLGQPRSWWSNRITRVLLVFALSSAGSAIGTWIAGLRIVEHLAA